MAGASTGGAETFCVDALLALQNAGIQQILLTRPHTQRLDELGAAGVEIRTALFGRMLRGVTQRAIQTAIAEFKPDIIQYWMGRAASYAVPGAHKNIGWFGGYYDLKRYQYMDAYVGVSYDIARHIRESLDVPDHLGAAADKVFTIHTIADLKPAAPISRAEFHTPEHAPLLLVLSRLHSKKGIDVLLHALVDLPAAYAWIAGDGPIEKQLKKLCTKLGLDDRVRWLGWRNDRAALLATCDVCVFPSRYEPFGTVMVEAWAAGRPLVAAAAAGPKAYVKDEQNGLLVPVDNVDALSHAIARVMSDADLRARIIAGGHETYAANFTPAVMVQAYKKLYDQIRG